MSNIKAIENEVILNGRTHNQCWFSPGITVVQGKTPCSIPEVFINVNQLVGDDCGLNHFTRTKDMGRHWTPPMESQNLLGIARADDFFEKPNISLFYHHATKKLIGLGATQFYRDAGNSTGYKMESIARSNECKNKNTMIYTEWDFEQSDFISWTPIDLPPELKTFHYVAWPKIDIELDDGTVLCPFYLRESADDLYTAAAVMHARIDDKGFHCLELGNLLRVDSKRGLAEPSLIHFQDKYLMTVRHDEQAYVCTSDDGLHYTEPTPWLFEDGSKLGNFNTQQHWLVQGDCLFLLYNRRSALNNGVFRCRAPLYIAEVNPKTLRIIRKSEQVVFPEKGARMGNFNVVNVTDNEAWVVTGEWLEGLVSGQKEGDRFYFPGAAPTFNRIQYLGDLLLAKIRF